MSKKVIWSLYAFGLLVAIAGIIIGATGYSGLSKTPKGLEVSFEQVEAKGYTLIAEKYWGTTYMAVFQKKGLASHAGTAKLGGIVAQKQKGLWEPVAKSLSFDKVGTYGEISKNEITFRKLGPEQYGFLLQIKDGKQGFFIERTSAYSIVENNFTKLLDVPTYSDNTGGVLPGEGGTMKAALNILPTSTDGFYDISLTFSTEGVVSDRFEGYEEFMKIFQDTDTAYFVYKNGAYVQEIK